MVDFGVLPSTGIFLSDSSVRYPTRQLAFNYCGHCACIVQIRSKTHGADYTEVGRGTQRQFPDYSEDIVSKVLALCKSPSDLLVEVGSNDGTFLTHLRDAGIENMLGIEPSRSLAEFSRSNGHRVENTSLDESTALRIQTLYGFAKVVVCRHTLEHVPDPLSFVKALRSLLKSDGLIFIEVPSAAPILDIRLHGYELWDEHLNYFSESNLECILGRAGFSVRIMETRSHCGSENILCWAEPAKYKRSWTPSPITLEMVADCESFAVRWQSFSEKLRAQLRSLPRPLFAMGASHPQTNFLHFTGVMGSVDGLFDDDIFKQGKWVPTNRPVQIFASKDMVTTAQGGTIILTGFGYPKWMNSVKQSLSNSDICFLACGPSLESV